MRKIITGQQEADINNVRELNKKLTRMLEEEMMKNMALKEVRWVSRDRFPAVPINADLLHG